MGEKPSKAATAPAVSEMARTSTSSCCSQSAMLFLVLLALCTGAQLYSLKVLAVSLYNYRWFLACFITLCTLILSCLAIIWDECVRTAAKMRRRTFTFATAPISSNSDGSFMVPSFRARQLRAEPTDQTTTISSLQSTGSTSTSGSTGSKIPLSATNVYLSRPQGVATAEPDDQIAVTALQPMIVALQSKRKRHNRAAGRRQRLTSNTQPVGTADGYTGNGSFKWSASFSHPHQSTPPIGSVNAPEGQRGESSSVLPHEQAGDDRSDDEDAQHDSDEGDSEYEDEDDTSHMVEADGCRTSTSAQIEIYDTKFTRGGSSAPVKVSRRIARATSHQLVELYNRFQTAPQSESTSKTAAKYLYFAQGLRDALLQNRKLSVDSKRPDVSKGVVTASDVKSSRTPRSDGDGLKNSGLAALPAPSPTNADEKPHTQEPNPQTLEVVEGVLKSNRETFSRPFGIRDREVVPLFQSPQPDGHLHQHRHEPTDQLLSPRDFGSHQQHQAHHHNLSTVDVQYHSPHDLCPYGDQMTGELCELCEIDEHGGSAKVGTWLWLDQAILQTPQPPARQKGGRARGACERCLLNTFCCIWCCANPTTELSAYSSSHDSSSRSGSDSSGGCCPCVLTCRCDAPAMRQCCGAACPSWCCCNHYPVPPQPAPNYHDPDPDAPADPSFMPKLSMAMSADGPANGSNDYAHYQAYYGAAAPAAYQAECQMDRFTGVTPCASEESTLSAVSARRKPEIAADALSPYDFAARVAYGRESRTDCYRGCCLNECCLRAWIRCLPLPCFLALCTSDPVAVVSALAHAERQQQRHQEWKQTNKASPSPRDSSRILESYQPQDRSASNLSEPGLHGLAAPLSPPALNGPGSSAPNLSSQQPPVASPHVLPPPASGLALQSPHYFGGSQPTLAPICTTPLPSYFAGAVLQTPAGYGLVSPRPQTLEPGQGSHATNQGEVHSPVLPVLSPSASSLHTHRSKIPQRDVYLHAAPATVCNYISMFCILFCRGLVRGRYFSIGRLLLCCCRQGPKKPSSSRRAALQQLAPNSSQEPVSATALRPLLSLAVADSLAHISLILALGEISITSLVVITLLHTVLQAGFEALAHRIRSSEDASRTEVPSALSKTSAGADNQEFVRPVACHLILVERERNRLGGHSDDFPLTPDEAAELAILSLPHRSSIGVHPPASAFDRACLALDTLEDQDPQNLPTTLAQASLSNHERAGGKLSLLCNCRDKRTQRVWTLFGTIFYFTGFGMVIYELTCERDKLSPHSSARLNLSVALVVISSIASAVATHFRSSLYRHTPLAPPAPSSAFGTTDAETEKLLRTSLPAALDRLLSNMQDITVAPGSPKVGQLTSAHKDAGEENLLKGQVAPLESSIQTVTSGVVLAPRRPQGCERFACCRSSTRVALTARVISAGLFVRFVLLLGLSPLFILLQQAWSANGDEMTVSLTARAPTQVWKNVSQGLACLFAGSSSHKGDQCEDAWILQLHFAIFLLTSLVLPFLAYAVYSRTLKPPIRHRPSLSELIKKESQSGSWAGQLNEAETGVSSVDIAGFFGMGLIATVAIVPAVHSWLATPDMTHPAPHSGHKPKLLETILLGVSAAFAVLGAAIVWVTRSPRPTHIHLWKTLYDLDVLQGRVRASGNDTQTAPSSSTEEAPSSRYSGRRIGSKAGTSTTATTAAKRMDKR